MAWTDHLLQFWFGDARDDVSVATGQRALWWSQNPSQDAAIRDRFEPALQAELRGEHQTLTTPSQLLARIILLDQLSRNMYRGSAAAFAQDERARLLARQLLQRQQDRQLRRIERVFAYLPFEHSEQLADQQQSLMLFRELAAEAPTVQAELFQSFLDYAIRHSAVIERFGRYPHRNAALDRQSTAEERVFLQQPGSSF